MSELSKNVLNMDGEGGGGRCSHSPAIGMK